MGSNWRFAFAAAPAAVEPLCDMRIEHYRCTCGLVIRTMVSGDCLVPLVDRSAWRERCLNIEKIQRNPINCPLLRKALQGSPLEREGSD
jgi:hypothetical protein